MLTVIALIHIYKKNTNEDEYELEVGGRTTVPLTKHQFIYFLEELPVVLQEEACWEGKDKIVNVYYKKEI